MKQIVPLIPSEKKSPLLRARHLERLWLKLTLAAAGALATGYPDIGRGFDRATLDNLGLDEADVRAQFAEKPPPKLIDFERWVQETGTKVGRGDIAKHNAAIAGYIHGEDEQDRILGSADLSEAEIDPTAVELNPVDDADTLHALLFPEETAASEEAPAASAPQEEPA